MAKHRLGHALDVVGQDEVAPGNGRQGLGRAEQRDRRPRTAAQGHVVVLACALDDLQKIVAHLVVDVDLSDRFAAGDHFGGRDDRLQIVDRMPMLQPLEHLGFFFEARIAEAEADQEAVELGLGQRKRAFVIDRVLRGDDQERRLERVGLAVDRHAPLGHRFEQGRLRARRGPVDFVGQHDLREDRTGAKLELGRSSD